MPVTRQEAAKSVRNTNTGSGYMVGSCCFVWLLVCPRSLRVSPRGINLKVDLGWCPLLRLGPN